MFTEPVFFIGELETNMYRLINHESGILAYARAVQEDVWLR